MNLRAWLVSVLLGFGVSQISRADEPVVATATTSTAAQDSSTSVAQDKSKLQTDREQLAKLDEAIKQDKATHNVAQLKIDRAARRAAVQTRLQDKLQLKKDRGQTVKPVDAKAQ